MSWTGQAAEVIERLKGLEGEIQLQRRGDEYEIIYNGVFLMATYNGASEKEAIREALKIVSKRASGQLNVLMGGLGVGYSLREALASSRVGFVKVVEIEPAVIRWNSVHLEKFNNRALEDQRTRLVEGDFREVLTEESRAAEGSPEKKYHLVMVDTDNGSSWLSLPLNSFFYSGKGLQLIKSCLHVGGVACFWSSRREEDFETRLKIIFKKISFHTVLEKTGQEGCYYLAEKV